MNITEAMVLLDTLLSKPLNDLHALVFQQTWEGKSYPEIAALCQYDENYIKSVGSGLWKLLSEATGQNITKSNVRSRLEIVARSLIETSSSSAIAPNFAAQPGQDWGEAVDVSVFFGRTTELATLYQWVSIDHCRLVVVLGMGGIGKTALTVKLAHQLMGQDPDGCDFPIAGFQAVIWRSLRNAPPLETLLSDLIYFLSNHQDTQLSLTRLIYHLRKSRCLVILDNLETLLAEGSQAGQFRSGYEDYGELLRLLSEVNHNSCVMFTSREKPAEIAAYEGDNLPVRSLPLSGSAEVARALLQLRGLNGTAQQEEVLCDRYGNSPLALKIVATSIQDLFNGQIADFIAEDTFIFNGIRRLLDQQFKRLSDREQQILYWLAINREWTTVAELQEDMIPTPSKANVLEALESLSGRSLIEKQSGCYMQQPVVLEYVTEKFTEQIHRELTTHHFSTFLHYALIKTTVKDYVREAQSRLILGAIANQLLLTFGSLSAVESHLRRVLANLHDLQPSNLGYGPGNLINLCLYLNLDLSGYDFSHLNISHAYLQGKEVHRVNFSHATFSNCTFSETFGNILAIAFSPDGELIATGDANNLAHLWRVEDGQLLLTFRGHTDWVRSLIFSTDSQTLITGSDDQTIRFWDVHTGICQHTVSGPVSRVASLSLSPDGTMLASSGEDGSVHLWDVSQHGYVKRLSGHQQPSWVVRFSPDGALIASGSEDHTVRLWDAETGQCLKILDGHRNWVQAIAFSADGRILASGSDDHTIKLWDTETGICLQTLEGHTNWVWSLTICPHSPLLASASEDKTIRLWDLQTGQCVKILTGHNCRIWSVTFNPAGTLLASGSDDQTLRLWDTRTGHCLKILQGHTLKIFPVTFSPNGQILASSGDESIIRFWDVRTWEFYQTAERCGSRIESIAFSPDGNTLLSGGEDKILRLWNVESGQCFKRLEGHPKQIWTVAFSPDGQTIASSGEDGNLWLWDSATGQSLRDLEGHGNWVLTLAFSPKGEYLASASHDQTLKLWDVRTGKCLRTLAEHTNAVTGVAFNPEGHLLASGSFDQTVKIWDVNTGQCLNTLEGHTDILISVAFSPDHALLASASFDSTIRLWDISTGACLRTLTGHTEPIWGISFHPHSQILASGSWDETIRIWDVQTGDCVQVLRSDRPYEGTIITGITGLSEAQKATWVALGAVS